MGKKIDRLEVGKTYRLVDKGGYFNSYLDNNSIAETYMPNGVITITEDLLHDPIDIISEQELEFFELVEDEPYLWDGKEEVQVGMKLTAVNACDTELTLERINPAGDGYDTQYIVSEVNDKKMHILYYEDLRTLVPDPKVAFSKKMLAKVRSSHPDFAHDNTWDIVELAGMCFDELKGGNCSG